VICDLLVTHHPPEQASYGRGAAALTGSGFRHKFSLKKKYPQDQGILYYTSSTLPLPGPKNRLERRVSRFSRICAKNQVLNLIVDKVTTILRRKCAFVLE
jgi:hypothetical protein